MLIVFRSYEVRVLLCVLLFENIDVEKFTRHPIIILI
jgi:hypothetical protein